MKSLKYKVALVFILSLVGCATGKQIQDKAPTEIEKVYFQRSNSGIEEGN